jgi:hypothetical protein
MDFGVTLLLDAHLKLNVCSSLFLVHVWHLSPVTLPRLLPLLLNYQLLVMRSNQRMFKIDSFKNISPKYFLLFKIYEILIVSKANISFFYLKVILAEFVDNPNGIIFLLYYLIWQYIITTITITITQSSLFLLFNFTTPLQSWTNLD